MEEAVVVVVVVVVARRKVVGLVIVTREKSHDQIWELSISCLPSGTLTNIPCPTSFAPLPYHLLTRPTVAMQHVIPNLIRYHRDDTIHSLLAPH